MPKFFQNIFRKTKKLIVEKYDKFRYTNINGMTYMSQKEKKKGLVSLMAIITFKKGQLICQAKEPLKELYVIGEGTVEVTFPGGRLTLSKGDVIGIQDIKSGTHSCTYTAAEDTSLLPYTFTSLPQLLTLFQSKPNIMHLFFTSSARFSNSLLKCCANRSRYETGEASVSEEPAVMDEDDEKIRSEAEELEQEALKKESPAQAPKEEPVPPAPDIAIPSVADNAEIPPQLANALSEILAYGNCEEELSKRFRQEVASYKAMPDRDSTQDADRALRNTLTGDFYKIYKQVFETSLEKPDMPAPVKLFLTFGFVDAELAGAANSVWLLSIADSYQGSSAHGIYTMYEWLLAIYHGKKEPSRNEFDLDYPAYLREQKTSGNITAQQEKELLCSNIDKVRFELENVFPIANKMTFGRISTFCPILSAHNLLKPLPDTIVTPNRVNRTMQSILEVDFSAFYRETGYSDEKRGIIREYIDVEVRPDIILMPNAGIRGAMWQEIEGKRRTTPARMMISVIALENITRLLTHMTGEFRWEMCKRIQGAHWNNIAERSLTSEYTDYAQFYRRNHDLSPEAKEKIKLNLQKAKNSIKEMFVMDYMAWIAYEGKGSPRLNKLARTILFTYCPLPLAAREALKQHPLYKDLIARYQLTLNQKQHHLEMLCTKIEKTGCPIPEEIERQKEFLKR